MRKDGLLEYASVTCLMGVTAGETKSELSGFPTEPGKRPQANPSGFNAGDLQFFTLVVQQHHDAVTVGVAVKMPRDDAAVLPEDGDQPLVVALSDSGDVPGEGQVPHWHVADDVHLQPRANQRKKAGAPRGEGRRPTFSRLRVAFSSVFSSQSNWPAGSVALHVTWFGP